jgi:hypothetical protein
MPTTADILAFLHLALLAAFIGVASLSMLLTLISHLRVRRALLSWQQGRLGGIPLGPACFLLVALGGITYALVQGHPMRPSVLVGYPAGGAFWFVAAYLARSVLVTEYGLIHDVNRISQAVAWSQVVDYFVVETGRDVRYVFLYREPGAPHRHRLELTVPARHVEGFQRVIHQKLEARFTTATHAPLNPKPHEE